MTGPFGCVRSGRSRDYIKHIIFHICYFNCLLAFRNYGNGSGRAWNENSETNKNTFAAVRSPTLDRIFYSIVDKINSFATSVEELSQASLRKGAGEKLWLNRSLQMVVMNAFF